MKKFIALFTAAFLLAGCANSGPIIDEQAQDMSNYNKDLAECERYAEQVNSSGQMARQGAKGAVVGGAVGAIFGGSRGAAQGAGSGAVLGAADGHGDARREQEQVVKNCLRNRGYRVLN